MTKTTTREAAKLAAIKYGQMEREAFARAEAATSEKERETALSWTESHGDNADKAWSQYFSSVQP